MKSHKLPTLDCPYCDKPSDKPRGSFRRKTDGRTIQRFYCKPCDRTFSRRSSKPDAYHRKKFLNKEIPELLCCGVSQRAIAKKLNVDRKTVERKIIWKAKQIKKSITQVSTKICKQILFDEMESFEHTKCKPISIHIAVSNTREILHIEAGSMPAKGRLAEISRLKYGKRKDDRPKLFPSMMRTVLKRTNANTIFKSDQNPHYRRPFRAFFPDHEYQQFKGRRGCVVGYGELKEGGFDPLFKLNHTCAMVRDRIKRMTRRTWCTSKRIDRLNEILTIYAWFHNTSLILR